MKITYGSKRILFMLTYILAIILRALTINAGTSFLILHFHVVCIYVIFCSREYANASMH
ncbi:hypothetical protein BDR22DRAFT_852772 [Usnea florida]